MWDLLGVLRPHNPEVVLEARYSNGALYIVAQLARQRTLLESPARWTSPLPTAKTLMQDQWPSIADVFCAFWFPRTECIHCGDQGPESSSVHIALRLPVISKKSGEELLQWARSQDAMEVDDAPDGTSGLNLREMRRQLRSQWARKPTTALPPRKRRRGVRKCFWAKGHKTSYGATKEKSLWSSPSVFFYFGTSIYRKL